MWIGNKSVSGNDIDTTVSQCHSCGGEHISKRGCENRLYVTQPRRVVGAFSENPGARPMCSPYCLETAFEGLGYCTPLKRPGQAPRVCVYPERLHLLTLTNRVVHGIRGWLADKRRKEG